MFIGKIFPLFIFFPLFMEIIHGIQIDRAYYVGKHNYNSLMDIDKFQSNSTILPKTTRKYKYRKGDESIKIQSLKNKWDDSLESILDTIHLPSGPKEPEQSVEKATTREVINPENDVTSGRFLGIFEVVNFNNVACVSNSGIQGLCLHILECTASQGMESGVCAGGYGICCVFQYSCGDQSSANCSTFTNPGFPMPSTDQLTCTFTINKASQDISQLRIDFVQLELQPPTNGTCVNDQLVISGQNINNVIPIMCGINNGQHVFVEVNDVPGPIYLSVLSAGAEQRLFQVNVCQITGRGVPRGCLQYFAEPQGTIESFNYVPYSTLPITRNPGYFNNLNYGICIERAPNMCSITYYNDQDAIFQILNYDADGVPVIPPGQAGAEIFNCPDDFIVVNGIRLCGERLNDASITEDFTIHAQVTELSSGPIVFTFRTNGNVSGRGFRLKYQQNPCVLPLK